MIRIIASLHTNVVSANDYAADYISGYNQSAFNEALSSFTTSLGLTQTTIYGDTETFVSKDGAFNPLLSVSNATVTWTGSELLVSNVTHSLTVDDISSPVYLFNDYRTENGDSSADVAVMQLNYGTTLDGKGNLIDSAKIVLNGHDRLAERKGSYFNFVQPSQHHKRTPADGINVYSFGLHPEQHQPTGTCNMSRIDDARLVYKIIDPYKRTRKVAIDIYTGTIVIIYARCYNVLRVMSGMAGVAYSN
jgi:hypothetical protein